MNRHACQRLKDWARAHGERFAATSEIAPGLGLRPLYSGSRDEGQCLTDVHLLTVAFTGEKPDSSFLICLGGRITSGLGKTLA